MTACPPVAEPRRIGRWKHGTIPVLGLIGGVGSGKSRVAQLAAHARGYHALGELNVRPAVTYLPIVRNRSTGEEANRHG